MSNEKKNGARPAPRTEWVDVTPALAKEWLKKNCVLNRPLSLTTVGEYARLMEIGNGHDGWDSEAPHTPIAFDWDDNLVNGQHRLRAIIASGRTIRCLVMWNVDPESYRNTDQGKIRGASDHFAVMFKKSRGVDAKNHKWVTSIARAMMNGVGNRNDFSKIEIAELGFRHHDAIQEALALLKKKTNHVFTAPLAAAFVNAGLYWGWEHVAPHAERLGSGLWTGPRDPMKALADGLIRAMPQKVEGSSRQAWSKYLEPGAHYGSAITAIRAALKGRSIQRVDPTTLDVGQGDGDSGLRKRLGQRGPVDLPMRVWTPPAQVPDATPEAPEAPAEQAGVEG